MREVPSAGLGSPALRQAGMPDATLWGRRAVLASPRPDHRLRTGGRSPLRPWNDTPATTLCQPRRVGPRCSQCVRLVGRGIRALPDGPGSDELGARLWSGVAGDKPFLRLGEQRFPKWWDPPSRGFGAARNGVRMRSRNCVVSSKTGVTCCKHGGSGSSDRFCPPIQGKGKTGRKAEGRRQKTVTGNQ
jgi:hypothetical protein